jgi:hypothetical protein
MLAHQWELPFVVLHVVNFGSRVRAHPYIIDRSVSNTHAHTHCHTHTYARAHTHTHTFTHTRYIESVNPIITYDKEWERIGATYARPFSGGVSWDATNAEYRMWYGCGDSVSDDSNLALCLATSTDGITWAKPKRSVVKGTNIVVPTPLRSNNVWAHPTAKDPARRFVLADTNAPTAPGSSYWVWGSPDGVTDWTPVLNKTGPTADRGTMFHDPFRRRWVFSIKGYRSDVNKEYGRHRMCVVPSACLSHQYFC